MAIRASVFIATSLDGFISRKDGSIDWLDKANGLVPKGEDFGYKDLMGSIDALVMGRNTYEQVLTFDPWPYGETRLIVLSSNTISIPDRLARTVSHSSESPKELVRRLEAEGAKRLYVDGGVTIQRFLAEGLIDDLTITVIPVVLGEGRPLFGPLSGDLHVSLQSAQGYSCGFVQLRYKVSRAESSRAQ